MNGKTAGRRLLRRALVLAVAAVLAGTMSHPQARAASPLGERARLVLAKALGVDPATLRVVREGTVDYPLTGKSAYAFKILDAANKLHELTLDPQEAVADNASLLAAEGSLYFSRYGKLSQDLFETLAETGGSEQVPVTIWFHTTLTSHIERPPSHQAPPSGRADHRRRHGGRDDHDGHHDRDSRRGGDHDRDDDDDDAGAADARLLRHVQEEQEALIAAELGPLYAAVRALDPNAYGDPAAPMLSARLTPDQIRQIAAWPQVSTISLPGVGSVSVADVQSDLVHDARGVTGLIENDPVHPTNGKGGRLAIVELNGDKIAAPVPFVSMDHVTLANDGLCDGSNGPHALYMLGMLGAVDGGPAIPRGIAPGALLWSGGTCLGTPGDTVVDQVTPATNAAVKWGANIISLAWGVNTRELKDVSKYYDRKAMENWITVVAAAGNGGIPTDITSEAGPCSRDDGNVHNPASGYNVLGVGGHDDRGTPDWTDNRVWDCSNFRNPLSAYSDRTKPDLTAPAVDIKTITGDVVSGTSFSAPIVGGVAALALDSASQVPGLRLSLWPESVRAILLATALGKPLLPPWTARTSTTWPVDEFYGAGGVYGLGAVQVARDTPGVGGWRGEAYHCTAPDVTPYRVFLAAKRARIVLTWDNNPDFIPAYVPPATAHPSADLDLEILDPQGQPLMIAGQQVTSSSWDSTWELVDFVPPIAGTYTMQVRKARCDMDPKYLGLAWYQP
jgi:hypothetical protein